MGFIYKITNTVNGKSYIGQTSRTIEERFQRHLYNAKKGTYPLYRAIRKYGYENFSIKQLCECDNNELNEKEIYFISLYDTFNNGYNLTAGGGGVVGMYKKFSPQARNEIVKKYQELQNTHAVARIFNTSSSTIQRILKSFGIERKDREQAMREAKSISIDMLSLDGRYLRTFLSIKEAEIFLDREGGRVLISQVCKGKPKYKTAYGYKWRYHVEED